MGGRLRPEWVADFAGIRIIADRALLTGYVNSVRQIKKSIIRECVSELDISPAGKSGLLKKK